MDANGPDCEDWLSGKKSGGSPLTKIWCSDAHTLAGIGERWTWIKMTTPTIQGLQLAFLDGAASAIPDREPGDDPNQHAANCIESITISDAKHIGRGSPFELKFNPWFNSIIGGRGTGKSTVLDVIRKTLRREGELAESINASLRKDFDERMQPSASRDGTGLLTKETALGIVYRKDNARFLIEWQFGADSRVYRLAADGSKIPEDCDIASRFPIRIYSQKQLFHLAKEPNALLSVIDDSDTVKRAEPHQNIARLEQEYLALRASARLIRGKAEGLCNRKAELADITGRIELLREAGKGAAVVDVHESYLRQQAAWKATKQAALRDLEPLSEQDLSVLSFADAAEKDAGSIDRDLEAVHQKLVSLWSELEANIIALAENAKGELLALEESDEFRSWTARVDEAKSAYAEHIKTVGDLAARSGDQALDALLDQQDCMSRDVAEHKSLVEKAREAERDALEILEQVRAERKRLTCLRQEFAASTSDDRVKMTIRAFGDRGDFQAQLRLALGIQGFDRVYDQITEKCFDTNEVWDALAFDNQMAALRSIADGESPASHQVSDARFVKRLKSVQPEAFDRAALYMPEDAVVVQFSDDSGRHWKDLERGSPGQQTAALLAFVLSYGTEPILLDQPEDDLDNTLICDLVVERIRKSKQHRQIIAVTHNPNIVVHGDAELIISLKSKSDQTYIGYLGGMQEPSGRDEICRVMEGGREIFKKRYSRIMDPLGTRGSGSA